MTKLELNTDLSYIDETMQQLRKIRQKHMTTLEKLNINMIEAEGKILLITYKWFWWDIF
jgi:predicted ribonuclease toxin of YeeF-YezG toxin-antitoxin module